MSEIKSMGAVVVSRLARTLLAFVAVIGAGIAGWIIAVMFSIALAFLFFIFSDARSMDSFGNRFFAPVIAFFGGALAFGGVAAITSAAFASGRLWFKTIALIAIIGGAATAINPALAEWLAAPVAPVSDFLKRALLTPMR